MELERYRSVIQMVLRKHVGADAERVTGDLIQTLEIAQALVGEMRATQPLPMARATGSTGTQPVFDAIPPGAARTSSVVQVLSKTLPDRDLSIGIIDPAPVPGSERTLWMPGQAAAPPVALRPDQTQADPPPDIDYYESEPGKGDGCLRMRERLSSLLPLSVSVAIEGIAEPLMLERNISTPGLKFVHVSYSLAGDQALGPRVTLMTSQRYIDPGAIIKDITAQAMAVYSKEKRVLTPRVPQRIEPPSSLEMQKMLDRDRAAQSPITQEDAKIAQEWASRRGPDWR